MVCQTLIAMVSNYLKIVLRLITRQKTFAFINIFGLTIGLVGFILVFLYVRYELTYDNQHKKIDRLYMIVRDSYLDNNVYNFTPTPYPFKDVIVSEYPEIEKATRFDEWSRFLFHYGEKTFDEPVLVADKEVFDMFTFKFIEGNADKPFTDNASVVISQRMAEKYFGDENAIGKVIQINGKYDFTVTAVYEPFPPNSSMQNEIVLPFEFYKTIGRDLTQWNSNSVNVFVLLREGVDVKAFEEKLKPRLGKVQPSDKPDELFLHPYKDLHLYRFHYKPGGPIEYIYIFSFVGIAILALAAINYVNLVTARSVRRAKEIGIRKTVGAEKKQVVFQFLSESILFALISLNFAVLIVELVLPFLNFVIEKKLSIEYSNPILMFSLIGIALVAGLLAGLYPAFHLAGFSPVAVLKSSGKLKSGTFKSALVIVQFSVSIALIITSIILFRQFEHLRNMPIGFSKENIFYFKLEDEAQKHFETLKKELQEVPNVSSVSVAGHLPTQIGSNGGGFNWEGKDPNKDVLISFSWSDAAYLKTFGMKLKDGRFFQEGENVVDTTNKIQKVVINQKLADITGFKEPVGKMLIADPWRYEIIGVISDFNFQQMRAEQSPLMMYYSPEGSQYGFVKVTGNPMEVKKQMDERYKKTFPQFPPNFQLLEDRYNQSFGYENRNAQLFGYFTLLAILISCLGLYGLASFIAEQRRKEMSIRKALGANTTGLSLLMLKDFAIWIVIANVIAIPVAWYYSNKLLSKYVFRTDISLWIFVVAALLSIVIATATVMFQVFKTARQNPATVLKYE
jgi:putative ABC transport system permease protein